MLNPTLLASTPFKSRTAYEDFIGQCILLYNAIIPATILKTGKVPKRIPIDASQPPWDLLQGIQSQHTSLALALGLAAPPDLQSFDLKDASQFASWTFLVGNDLARLKLAAGVN